MSQSNQPAAQDEVLENQAEQEHSQEQAHNEELNREPASESVEAEQAEAAEVTEDAQVSSNSEELLKQQADEHYQKLLRVQADYDNFRRRSRLEKEEFAKYASQKLIEELLPVYDNFDRALIAGKDSKDPDAFVKGVDMIFRQFAGVLEAEGVKPIEAVGQPFNPEFHQAIMQVESEEHDEGIVVEEVQKGYIMKDKVIRPSMVKVSS